MRLSGALLSKYRESMTRVGVGDGRTSRHRSSLTSRPVNLQSSLKGESFLFALVCTFLHLKKSCGGGGKGRWGGPVMTSSFPQSPGPQLAASAALVHIEAVGIWSPRLAKKALQKNDS